MRSVAGMCVLLGMAVALALAGCTAGEGASSDGQPPNIVFIMVDDMGYSDLGSYGNNPVRTPEIDRLAAEGIRFTQAYAGSAVCAPSRSTLMTGTHMGHTPVRANLGGVSLRDEDVTIAEVLQEAGYATGGFGKWGIGEVGTEGVPEAQGFDTFFGYYHQIHAHYFYPDYLYRNSERVPLPGNERIYDGPAGGGQGQGPIPPVDSETGRERQYSQRLIVDAMKDFIRANRDGPFFAYAPWTPPHWRYELPEDDPAWARYADEPWPLYERVHAAMNTMVDRQVGEVVDLLDELGIREDTIIFFLSDNGADARLLGASYGSNEPLRGGKATLYEGGIRVPFIVNGPGRVEGGRVIDHLTYFPDVLPTLAVLAGAEEHVPDIVDGISIVPTLLGEEDGDRPQRVHEYLYWEYGENDWAELRYREETLAQAVRVGDWKALRRGPDAPLELYNLAADLGEEEDVAAAHPERVERMAAIMEAAHTPPPEQIEPERPDGRNYR